jgi:hypothetical protein
MGAVAVYRKHTQSSFVLFLSRDFKVNVELFNQNISFVFKLIYLNVRITMNRTT